jgi:hypothetical protein
MFLDIETVVNPSAIKMLDDPTPPRNIKDPDKIAAAIAEKRADIIELAPLDSDLAKIAGIGYAIGEDGPIVPNIVSKKNTEKKVIEDFWLQFALVRGRCAGYNIISFDLPFIMKRSFDLGVKPSIIPYLAKFRSEPITDLFMLLCNWDYRNGHKFKWVCKRYGVEILAEGVNGSMVKDMSEKELREYMISDVSAVRELYYKMRGYYFM